MAHSWDAAAPCSLPPPILGAPGELILLGVEMGEGVPILRLRFVRPNSYQPDATPGTY